MVVRAAETQQGEQQRRGPGELLLGFPQGLEVACLRRSPQYLRGLGTGTRGSPLGQPISAQLGPSDRTQASGSNPRPQPRPAPTQPSRQADRRG